MIFDFFSEDVKTSKGKQTKGQKVKSSKPERQAPPPPVPKRENTTIDGLESGNLEENYVPPLTRSAAQNLNNPFLQPGPERLRQQMPLGYKRSFTLFLSIYHFITIAYDFKYLNDTVKIDCRSTVKVNFKVDNLSFN